MKPTSFLPQEIVFSFCSRYHALSRNRLHAETTLDLFGHPRQGCAHDLPSRLNRLSVRFDGMLGSGEALARRHTLLPYYLPIRSEGMAEDAVLRLRGDGVGSLKFHLGLLTSRFRAHHPLKACIPCLARDKGEFGTSYWHLPDQLPGRWACLEHGTLLSVSRLKVDGIARFMWSLPDKRILEDSVREGFPDAAWDRLRAVADAALHWWSLPPGWHFDSVALIRTYLTGLLPRNLTSPDGRRLRLESAAQEFARYCQPLRSIPELSALPATVSDARAQIGRLFRRPRSGTHPIRHLVLISWLFDSWDKFVSTYCVHQHDDAALDEHEAVQDVEVPETPKNVPRSEVSDQTKQRRPKRLHVQIRRRIVDQLQAGGDPGAIATQFGFSRITIARIIREEPGLEEMWREMVQRQRIAEHRNRWVQHRDAQSTLGMKDLRILEPALFAWLYRNDRSWLREFGTPTRRSEGNNSNVNWDKRDRELADRVKAVTLRLRSSGVRVTRQDLLRALPELGPKLRKMDRLPLTMRALGDALRRQEDSVQPSLF